MLRQLAAATLLTFPLTLTLPAQATWTLLTPPAQPLGRTNAAGASDLSGLLMSGGNIGGNVFVDELWRFDGATWTQLTPATSTPPSPRMRHCVAYDEARGRLVLFGGTDNVIALGDTWEWNGTDWSQATPAAAPAPRYFAATVYEPGAGRCLLFGGWDNAVNFNDTWSWDGTSWTQLTPANAPTPRGRHAMAHDRMAGRTLLCGGQIGSNSANGLNDTWSWNGSDWQQIVTPTLPGTSRLIQAAMAYDLARGRMVLQGGYNGRYLSDTWEFAGGDWVHRGPTAGHEQAGQVMDYVIGLTRTVAFGGYYSAPGIAGTMQQETWEYQTNAFASFFVDGTGCAGSAGLPTLSSGSLPWIGTVFTVNVAGMAPFAGLFLVLGLSNTNWSGGALPFSLAAFGAPQCSLLVGDTATLYLTNQNGGATWNLALPNTPVLIGMTIYQQCLGLEVVGGGGGFSLAATNRGNAQIGAL